MKVCPCGREHNTHYNTIYCYECRLLPMDKRPVAPEQRRCCDGDYLTLPLVNPGDEPQCASTAHEDTIHALEAGARRDRVGRAKRRTVGLGRIVVRRN